VKSQWQEAANATAAQEDITSSDDAYVANLNQQFRNITATENILKNAVNISSTDPSKALKKREQEIKNTSLPIQKTEFTLGLGYNWKSANTIKVNLGQGISANIGISNEAQAAIDVLNVAQGAFTVSKTILNFAKPDIYLKPIYAIDAVFNFINSRKDVTTGAKIRGGTLVLDTNRLNLFKIKTPFIINPQIKDSSFTNSDTITYLKFTPAKIINSALQETGGRIPYIGKFLFGDYHQSVFRFADYPGIYNFGMEEAVYYANSLKDDNPSHIPFVIRKGDTAIGYMFDLKTRETKIYFKGLRFIKDAKGNVINEKFLKKYDLWMDDGQAYILPTLAMLSNIDEQYAVYNGLNGIVCALQNPVTGEIIQKYFSLQDARITVKQEVPYTRVGMNIFYGRKSEADVDTSVTLGEFSDGTAIHPVMVYSRAAAAYDYWLNRPLSKDEAANSGKIKADFIKPSSGLAPVAVYDGQKITDTTLGVACTLKVNNDTIILAEGSKAAYLDNHPAAVGIIVPKPAEGIPLARLTFANGVFYLYSQQEIDKLHTYKDYITGITYALFKNNLVAQMEYGVNAANYPADNSHWAYRLNNGNAQALSSLPLGVRDTSLQPGNMPVNLLELVLIATTLDNFSQQLKDKLNIGADFSSAKTASGKYKNEQAALIRKNEAHSQAKYRQEDNRMTAAGKDLIAAGCLDA